MIGMASAITVRNRGLMERGKWVSIETSITDDATGDALPVTAVLVRVYDPRLNESGALILTKGRSSTLWRTNFRIPDDAHYGSWVVRVELTFADATTDCSGYLLAFVVAAAI
jgi:hypothetical protein